MAFFIFALAALSFMIALPGLFMGLHADDWFQIQPRSLTQVLSTFAGDWHVGATGQGGFYRPLVRLLFHFESSIFGDAAWGYHLINGLLFIAVSLGVFAIALELNGGKAQMAFLVTAALFVLNPLKNESLYWISGRTDLLAALFALWSLYFFLRALARDRLASLFPGILLLLCAIASKEVGLALSLIVPLAVLILRPAGPFTVTQFMSFLLPLLIGFLYFLFRRSVLGGFGGYSSAIEPVSLTALVHPLAALLSALFWPWQADGPLLFRYELALPGLMLFLFLLLLTRLQRGPLFCFAAMLMALLPMSFILISPQDGTRVLLLPLAFQTLFVAALLRGTCGIPIILLLLVLSWVPDSIRTIQQFIDARKDNNRIIEEIYAGAHALPSEANLILTDPPRSRYRRILDPGIAPIFALQSLTLYRKPDAETKVVFEPAEGMLGHLLEASGKDIFIAPHLQIWMEKNIHHWEYDPEEDVLVRREFSRTQGPVAAPPSTETLVWENVSAILLLEALAEKDPGRSMQLVVEKEGATEVHEETFHPFGPYHRAIISSDELIMQHPFNARLEFPSRHSALRLHSVRWCEYTTVDN